MDKKTKDSVFSIILVLVGGYVVYEGVNMVELASQPPFNIKGFSISPGFFPVILGTALVLISCILLAFALAGEPSPAKALSGHLLAASRAFDASLENVDALRVMICVGIMFVYSFFILGQVPFWAGAFLFLFVLMRFLCATRMWIIAVSAAITVYGVIILFQDIFNTSLP